MMQEPNLEGEQEAAETRLNKRDKGNIFKYFYSEQ